MHGPCAHAQHYENQTRIYNQKRILSCLIMTNLTHREENLSDSDFASHECFLVPPSVKFSSFQCPYNPNLYKVFIGIFWSFSFRISLNLAGNHLIR